MCGAKMVNGTAKSVQSFPDSGGFARVSQRSILVLMLGTVALPVSGAWAQQILSGAQTTTQSPTGSPLAVTTSLSFSVDTTGPTAGGGIGVELYSTGGISFTDTNQAAITGFTSGINARNNDAAGLGGGGGTALTITTTGVVTAKDSGAYTPDGDGIFAENQYGGDLTISVTSVTGDRKGIDARAIGNTGALSITATGAVIGTNRAGIDAYNQGTDLTISANTVSGGIEAENKGSGLLSITATGEVIGSVQAINKYGTSLTINTAKVSGEGIAANHFGSGALQITASGAVSGGSANGIYAKNSNGTDLTISTTSVSGFYGIKAQNQGSGALSITATDGLTGSGNDGIRAYNKGTDLTISVTTVSGGSGGIVAQNRGLGLLSIAATGEVINQVFAENSGTDLTINVAKVSGSGGIFARHYGSGALEVTASGNVSSDFGDGIMARSYHGTDLTIAATSVSGDADGIETVNYGSGALSITATGAVSGRVEDGLYAKNNSNGTDLTISATSVSGGDNGIRAINKGSGELSITTTGAVSAGGDYSDGIAAVNYGTDLTISVNSVSGGKYEQAISAQNKGSGKLSITVSGAVVAGADSHATGIETRSDGGEVAIHLLSTSSVSGPEAITDRDGDAVVTIDAGALVTGSIQLNYGNDTLTIASGVDLSGINYLSGGESSNFTDTLNISSGWSGALDDWEVINADTSDGDFALDGFTLGNRSFGKLGAGTLTLNGAMTLESGSTLSMGIPQNSADPLILAAGTATIAGDLVVTIGQGISFGQDYTLIQSSGLTGTFGAVRAGSYTPILTYTATSVLLRFDQNASAQLYSDSLTPNAGAVASALDAAVEGGFDPAAFNKLYEQGDSLNAALGQLSGEVHSAERRVAFNDMRLVRDKALDRLAVGLTDGPDPTAVDGDDGTFWMRDMASTGTTAADGTGAKFTTNQGALLMGADFVMGDIVYGGMFDYAITKVDLSSLGHSKIASTGAAVYAGFRQNGSGLAFGVGGALARLSAKGNRSISIPGMEQSLTSMAGGTSYQVFGEVSDDLAKAENLQIGPFARLAYTMVQSDAFTETGGIAALSGTKQENEERMATLGLRGAYVTGDTTVSISGAWQHSIGDRSAPTTLSMAGLNTPFEVNSAAHDQDTLELAAQASVYLSSGATLAGGYIGTIGNSNSTHGLRVTLSMEW
jgi:uncharacterized protein with beta-barrel porin domain